MQRRKGRAGEGVDRWGRGRLRDGALVPPPPKKKHNTFRLQSTAPPGLQFANHDVFAFHRATRRRRCELDGRRRRKEQGIRHHQRIRTHTHTHLTQVDWFAPPSLSSLCWRRHGAVFLSSFAALAAAVFFSHHHYSATKSCAYLTPVRVFVCVCVSVSRSVSRFVSVSVFVSLCVSLCLSLCPPSNNCQRLSPVSRLPCPSLGGRRCSGKVARSSRRGM